MYNLTSFAMAKLRIKRLLSTELVLHPSAMAACFVQRVKILVLFMHPIRSSEFPLIELTFHFFRFAAGGFGL
jgi:hypothetical protein